MPKAMIITVGAQGKQVIFSLKEEKPERLGVLGTNTPECESTVNHILKEYGILATNYKYFSFPDHPDEIGNLIDKFREIYDWLTKSKGVVPEDIIVDSTGGRKWMSSGATMIASFLGLRMIYVDAKYRDGELDPSTIKIVQLGNAYDQTGFLEEDKADKLFNQCNFTAALDIYDFLSQKLQDMRRILIKKDISQGYLNWMQFKFEPAYRFLGKALKEIKRFKMLKEYEDILEKQMCILDILKKNDEKENSQQKYSYFELLKDENFSTTSLLFLYSLQAKFAENQWYEQAVIVLYRILEFISQFRLALGDIDTSNITAAVRRQYNEEFRKITKEVFGGGREIPDKIALMENWILLYCLKDELLENENKRFLLKLRGKTEPRNMLWIEHGNKSVDEATCGDFQKYVGYWLKKAIPGYEEAMPDYSFINF